MGDVEAAWNVSPGTSPKGVVVRLNNAGHSDSDLTHEAMMLASELNVRSVEVSTPLGGAARTSAMPPVSTSARLPAIAAALPMPGNGPAMPSGTMNWARANAAAIVVRSLITTLDGMEDLPSMAAASAIGDGSSGFSGPTAVR